MQRARVNLAAIVERARYCRQKEKGVKTGCEARRYLYFVLHQYRLEKFLTGDINRMDFTRSPSGMMRIRYGHHWPGLGHQLTSLCYILHYCSMHDIYPLIEDSSTNAYGKWTDYFEPFWNEDEKQGLLRKSGSIPITDGDIVDWSWSRSGLFGAGWSDLSDSIQEIFRGIFVIKQSVNKAIVERINLMKLPDQYSSVHIRRGDKNTQFKDYGKQSDLQIIRELEKVLTDKSVENVFLMSDDYQIVEIMRRQTPFQIFTLCSPTSDGHAGRLRTSKGHTLDLLTDISVANNADSHYQTVNTRVSKMIRILRRDKNCFHIFNSSYTVDTAL